MSRGRYNSLPKSEEEIEASVQPASEISGRRATTGSSWLSILAWSATLASAIATLTTVHLIISTNPVPAKTPLKRLTPYVNPERLRAVIAAHNATFEPVINAGVASFTMKHGDPKRAIDEDTSRQVHTHLGDVWPEDRHILVSKRTSTVLQYRHRDFDMEKCVLSVTIPTPADGFDPAVHITNSSRVNIYQLDSDAEELLPSISWGIAPPRRRKLMTVDFDSTTNVTSRPYHCLSGAFSTFELECAGGSLCTVDFWQTRRHKGGILIIQYQTNGHDVAGLD